MESQEISRQVVVSSGDSQSAGTLTIHYFSPRERFQRALKAGSVSLLALIVCACIPGAHIILVPICLLVAPIVIVRVWRVTSAISATQVKCARCHGELTKLATYERYPIYENCLSCQRENKIQLAATAT